MPLDATPKGVNSNAYCTRSFADAFIAEQMVDTAAWTALDGPSKDARIILGAKLLDACFEWDGAPRTLDQAMAWPRYGVQRRQEMNWLDYDTIPLVLQEADAEMACFLARRPDRAGEPELLGLGMRQVGAGGVNITIDPAMVLPLIPETIRIKLWYLGTPKPAADPTAGAFLKVIRT